MNFVRRRQKCPQSSELIPIYWNVNVLGAGKGGRCGEWERVWKIGSVKQAVFGFLCFRFLPKMGRLTAPRLRACDTSLEFPKGSCPIFAADTGWGQRALSQDAAVYGCDFVSRCIRPRLRPTTPIAGPLLFAVGDLWRGSSIGQYERLITSKRRVKSCPRVQPSIHHLGHPRCVYTRARKTLKVVFTRRLYVGWCRSR